MDAIDLFQQRHSCRAYSSAAVPPETIQRLLDAACRAPSAGNLQPWRWLVVQDARLRQALAAAALDQGFLAEAPIVIVVCAVPEESATIYGQRGRELYCLQDTAAATENLLLAATAMGLGCCWVGAFSETEVTMALDLGPDLVPVALVPIGHSRQAPERSPRRPLAQVVLWR
jgi:nitroreductase